MDMIKRKFLLMLLCSIGTIMFPLNTFAVQTSFSGYVGDEFTLKEPSVSILAMKIKSVTWSGQYQDGISCYTMSGYLKVRITSYFEGPKNITCDVAYEWESNGGKYTGHSRESYTIRCNPVEIIVNNPNMTMKVGQEQAISYQLSPSKTAKLTFKSNDYNVATVDDLGYVKAVGVGSARITIEQNMGSSATCNVTVTEPVAATAISLPSVATVDVYSSRMLYPTLQPSNANPTLTWESDNTSIASVDQNGKVTGNNPGTATISVTTDNNLSASCVVTVKDVDRTPQQFSFVQETPQKSIYVGETYGVKYQVTPSYARFTLRWTSSDNSVATVDYGGMVTALKPGTARITATIDDSALTDYCDLIVKGTPNVFTIWHPTGQRTDIKLSDHINMAVEADKFIVRSATVDVEYDALNVAKFTLENDGSGETDVKAIKTDEITRAMNYDGNVIYLSGFSPGSMVQIFAVNGQIEGKYRIGHDGCLTIPLDPLSRGIHIVKTESITYKIIKK